jgi:deoxyribonuclease IV
MKQLQPIGIHVSIAKSIDLAIDRALDLGCTKTFQIFTCSPRRWAATEIEPSAGEAFKEKIMKSNFEPFAHMPYMPNISSPERGFFNESVKVLIREIKRCDQIGIKGLVVHFGSHLSSSITEGHARVIEACNRAIEKTTDSPVKILLENSAGTRNSVGSKFEYIKFVLDRVKESERAGTCLDTCHLFASGYDIRTQQAAEETVDLFDKVVGMDRLFVIHVNDSKFELGSGRDRHEHIGLGKIGSEGFRNFFAVRKIKELPLVLETPIDAVRGDKENVAYAKKLLQASEIK